VSEDKTAQRVGVLLVNMGSPGSPAEIRPYLKKMFSDPAILDAPLGFIVRPLLSSYIARRRAPKTAARYEAVGGMSPLVEITYKQCLQLAAALEAGGGDWRVAAAMRYSEPGTAFSFDALIEAGCGRVVVCPLYPQYCGATTGSAFREIREIAKRKAPDMPVTFIKSYYNHPGYLDAVESTVRDAIDTFPLELRDTVVTIFSAHSVPRKFVRRGDPYVDEVRMTVERVAARLKLRHWRLSFQSAGPGRWMKPTTRDTMRMLAGLKAANVIVVPVSFVSDNLETLYDMDVELAELAKELSFKMLRAPAINQRPVFIMALMDIIKKHLAAVTTAEKENATCALL